MDMHIKLPKRGQSTSKAGPGVAGVQVRPSACWIPPRGDELVVPRVESLLGIKTFT